MIEATVACSSSTGIGSASSAGRSRPATALVAAAHKVFAAGLAPLHKLLSPSLLLLLLLLLLLCGRRRGGPLLFSQLLLRSIHLHGLHGLSPIAGCCCCRCRHSDAVVTVGTALACRSQPGQKQLLQQAVRHHAPQPALQRRLLALWHLLLQPAQHVLQQQEQGQRECTQFVMQS